MSGRAIWLAGVLGGALLLLWCLLALPGAAGQKFMANSVIISEVAWSGTAANPSHEWLELYNAGDVPVDLSGWILTDDEVLCALSGNIPPQGFLVLERYEAGLIDVAADHFLLGVLSDSGETIRLLDHAGDVVDSANIAGEAWPAGTAAEQFRSMERAHPQASDEPESWISNNGSTRNGTDANGHPVNGTPGRPNSTWDALSRPDLALRKLGQTVATAGDSLHYRLTVSNTGTISAADVVVTDTLPQEANFTAHDGHYSITSPSPGTIVWQVGIIDPGVSISISLTATLPISLSGLITNTAEVYGTGMELDLQNNRDSVVTLVSMPAAHILLDAVYYDGYEPNDMDEAVRLVNVGGQAQDLAGWRLSDGLSDALFPAGVFLEPGETIWIADRAANFRRQFGHDPDYEVRGADPSVPNLEGTWPGFSNQGDEVLLYSESGAAEDVLVYEDGNVDHPGWSGPAVEPYALAGVFAAQGQVLYRLPGASPGVRMPDTDSANDWAQSTNDAVNARRVRYPGWDVERFQATEWFTETAELVIGIAPDNTFELLSQELAGAQSQLRLASHTFRSLALKDELVAALDLGVSVTVLLEGDPVGGIDAAQRVICQELQIAGGQCWFMINDPDRDIHDRYRYLHAKYIIVDDRRVIVSSENLSPDSHPDGDQSNGTMGRRGVLLATDAPSVVNRLQTLWNHDFDPQNHHDLAPWSEVEGTSGPTVTMEWEPDASRELTYSVRYTEPARLSGEWAMAVVQSPENALGAEDGLLHLLARAAEGDTVLVEQLSERPHWGATGSNPAQDPNPRLEAMFDASRRGATVRLLLDAYFDNSGSAVSNEATCAYVNHTADVEHLNMRCERANPSGLGLHNKMILVELDGRGYVFVGSINGTELSNKGNRELALLFQSDGAYAVLADMFTRDWPHRILLPLIYREFLGPAAHVLISEVFYDPPGQDDREFIELLNPTYGPLDLSGYAIGDALNKSDFEDVRDFPDGTVLDSRSVLIIATTATGFYDQFGFRPDFEIVESDPLVPNLHDNGEWGDPAAFLQLANEGDEVIVRDASGHIIEAIAYGSGHVPGNVSCPVNTIAGAVLERYPPWRDTDNCPADFREWPFPNPGIVPWGY